MKKVIINENQRGFLFKNGRFQKLLGPGKYRCCFGKEIEVISLQSPLASAKSDLDTLLSHKEIADNVSVVEVADQHLALHFVDGKFYQLLPRGKYAFWAVSQQHSCQTVDISDPWVADSIPRYIFSQIPGIYFTRIDVAQYQKARLFFDKKLEKVLDPGSYYFWRNGTQVEADFVDTRLTQMNITGQELLTLDKVALRVSFVCTYRVTDYVKILTEIDNYAEQMHVAAQLALREYVGKCKLDEILENKEQMSQFVLEKLKAREAELFVQITEAGVKDIILPGEIRDIMNTVLLAEKQAQANVIARREEVASTRSLLNTAKLMDENQTLYKLKELEYVERICENVGSISLNGSGDVLNQLTALLRSKAE